MRLLKMEAERIPGFFDAGSKPEAFKTGADQRIAGHGQGHAPDVGAAGDGGIAADGFKQAAARFSEHREQRSGNATQNVEPDDSRLASQAMQAGHRDHTAAEDQADE